MHREPIVVNLSRESGLTRVVFLIFGLFCLLITTAFLVLSIVADIPLTVNDKVFYKGDLEYTLHSALIFTVLLAVSLFLLYQTIKSMLFRSCLIIDREKGELILSEQNILTKKERRKAPIAIKDVEEIVLMLIGRPEGESNAYEYRIYTVDSEKYYDLITTYSSYDKSLALVKFLSDSTGLSYNDITDIDYNNEYDFLKFYKRREE